MPRANGKRRGAWPISIVSPRVRSNDAGLRRSDRVLGRAEGFARRNGIGAAVMDGFTMGLGFLLALLAMGVVREAIGSGTLFSQMHLVFGGSESLYLIRLPNEPFLLIVLPPGAFFVLGCLIALKNIIDQRYARQQSTTTSSPRQTLSDEL